ncbi:hypothetical protein [Variovorax sp. LjRoot178]|uniref:hypothetical protein n=1 Tax=Variovorax sp. LjRoot178 TaxID=3342277 RepID=UPI003ECE41E6
MNSYDERAGRRPDFVVRYRFLTVDEGGRQGPFLQHTRWDFLFEADAASLDGLAMIRPEAIDQTGAALPEGEIASAGRAAMFIVNPERRQFHLGSYSRPTPTLNSVSEFFMDPRSLLPQLETPLSECALDTPVVQVLLAGLSSPTDYWPGLAIGWLEQGAPVDAEVLAAVRRVSANQQFAQSVRHRGDAILRRHGRGAG